MEIIFQPNLNKGIMLQVSEILKAKHMERFFTLDYSDAKGLTFSLDEAAITKESLRNGKFLVRPTLICRRWR